ncbi:DUF4974 domain-containing protein [Flavivirga amylovorans]
MNAANIDELEILANWLKKDEHKQIFKSYIKTNYAMDINTNEFDTENAKKEYLRKIRLSKKTTYKFKIYKVLKYAAAAVIIFGMGYFFQQKGNTGSIEITEPIIVNNQIETGTDKATLTLENGDRIALVKGDTYQTQNVTSNGEKVIYNSSNTSRELVYNHLTIPRGGQFQLTLSDGTKVWLNSESQLKYPVAFNEGETREVELVYGEAYFDVSPSSEHEGAKFKVFNNSQEVEVLGTEFNIKAYKDETNIYTTLVEGKVEVTAGNTVKILSQSQQTNLNIVTKNVSVQEVSVRSQISWKEGLYMFKDKSLKEIMTTLSRWYDMEVVFADENLEGIPFNGALYKDQSIIDILNDIKNFGVIKNYEINNKTITLK